MLSPRQMEMLETREITSQMCVHNMRVTAFKPEDAPGAPGLFVVRLMGHMIFPNDFGDELDTVPDNRLAVHEFAMTEPEFAHMSASMGDALADFHAACGSPTDHDGSPGMISPDAFARLIGSIFPGIFGDQKREDDNGDGNRD